MIQFCQNGKKPEGTNLSVTDGAVMRAPFFEGVTGVTVQLKNPTPPPSPSIQEQTPSYQHNLQVTQQNPTQIYENNPSMQPVSVPQTEHSSVQTPSYDQTMTLVAQDPYNMKIEEQGRYETLFPQYEKDGFVYGKEAVTLFSKSGLNNENLRDIWNLVDNPVDNRLSKLEFCIAMHLIVCVTKKNLSLPSTLPPSLNMLQNGQNSETIGVNRSLEKPPLHRKSDNDGGSTFNRTSTDSITSVMGGMSVSDAFGDLDPGTASLGYGGQTQESEQQVPQQIIPPSSALASQPNIIPNEVAISQSVTEQMATGEQQTLDSPSVHIPLAKESPYNADANNYDTSLNLSEKVELERVKTQLQKMQAENVSLKAQLGQFSEEEKGIKKQVGNVNHEISELEKELTVLRNQVIESRASLLEATSDLKIQMEKKK